MLKIVLIIFGSATAAITLAFCKAAGQADKLPQPKIKHKD